MVSGKISRKLLIFYCAHFNIALQLLQQTVLCNHKILDAVQFIILLSQLLVKDNTQKKNVGWGILNDEFAIIFRHS